MIAFSRATQLLWSAVARPPLCYGGRIDGRVKPPYVPRTCARSRKSEGHRSRNATNTVSKSGGRAAALQGGFATLLLLLLAPLTFAQALTSTDRGVVVAHDGRVELAGRWNVEGVTHATAIVAGEDRVAVLDALNDEAVVVDLESGKATRIRTAATPVAATFLGRQLYILARDARLLQHEGGGIDIPLAADPAFLATFNGRLYIYARAAGVIEESDGTRILRRVQVAPFASDFEIAGGVAYLAYPREARIRTVSLASMKPGGDLAVGAVPVDLAFAGGGTALTARIVAVADPSAKRVWLAEGTQSTAEAVARGVVRGLLGLGLFHSRASDFPTGVDRVETRGPVWIAYDTSSGTLYRFTRKGSTLLARNVAPGGFALTARGVAWWDGTSVAEKTLR